MGGLVVLQAQHDTPVSRAAFGGAIAGNGIAVAVKTHAEQGLIHALFHQIVSHRQRPLARQLAIIQPVALIVGVAIEHNLVQLIRSLNVLQHGRRSAHSRQSES